MRTALCCVLVIAAIGLGGCSAIQVDINGASVDAGDPANVVRTAKDQAKTAGCAAIRQELDRRYVLASSQAVNAEVSVSFGAVLKKLGKGCPGGGAYTYDEQARTTVCSVHP